MVWILLRIGVDSLGYFRIIFEDKGYAPDIRSPGTTYCTNDSDLRVDVLINTIDNLSENQSLQADLLNYSISYIVMRVSLKFPMLSI